MAQKHGLEDLKKASLSALEHEPLIGYAREAESPTQAYKMALGFKWPDRQAKSTRSLAQLKRDFGTEVFETFVKSMEPVRSEESGHVQETKMERIVNAVARISNPSKKIEILLQHGLIGEVEKYFDYLIATGTPYFQYSEGGGHVPSFFTEAMYHTPEWQTTDDSVKKVVLVVRLEPNASLARGSVGTEVGFDLFGLFGAFQYNVHKANALVLKVIQLVVARPPKEVDYWSVRGIRVVTRHFVSDFSKVESLDAANRDLVKSVERWYAKYLFTEPERVGEYRDRLLDLPRIGRHAENPMDELDPIVERMLAAGMEQSEIRDLALNALDWFIANNGLCHRAVMLAGCSAIEKGDVQRRDIIRKHMKKMWDDLVRMCFRDLAVFCQLYEWANIPYGDNGFAGEVKSYFRKSLITMISEGRVARVYQMLKHAGDNLDLIPSENMRGRDEAMIYFHAILPEAFDQAYKAEQYGVAAALVQHFGVTDCSRPKPEYGNRRGEAEDLTRGQIERKKKAEEVTQIAVDLGQPIKLDITSFLTQKQSD